MRSSGRIPKQIPIILIGSDLDGRVFSEHTTTVLLSLHGAGVLSRHKLSPEQELVLRWPEKNKEAEIRVVGHLGTQGARHTYGVAFFDATLNFWEVAFPPISELEMQLGFLTVVCTSCNLQEKIDDTSVEADVASTNDGVIRSCKRCGAATLWKIAPNGAAQPQAPGEISQLPLFAAPPPQPPGPTRPAPSDALPAPTSPPVPSALPAPIPFYAQPLNSSTDPLSSQSGSQAAVLIISPAVPEKPAAPRVNRRKHPRVKVNYSACVRHPVRGDEIAQCEDMSKGGLRFKSPIQYYAQSLIEVAVPYEKGQPAIFVPALIVFVEELPEQHLFRYGVQYLKATKPRDFY